MRFLRTGLPLLPLLLGVFSSPSSAQIVTGSITGTVADKSGSPMAGVNVRLTSETTAAAREAATDGEGHFQLNAIQPGNYTLAIQHPGFKRYEKKGIELTPDEKLAVGTIQLDVGDVTESITVKAEGTVVQTASGERSGVITSDEVENLTVMNRDFATLVALLPGVVDNPGTAEVQGFSDNASFNVQGGRSNSNSIMIDGASTENSNAGNPNNFVSMDSVQTVRIMVSNFQAEFGRKPGASIMAVSKGGAQRYHGAAYWYYRHEWMNANDFFNNRNGVKPTPRRVTTPGFNIGGPIYIPGKFNRNKDKLFFFTSLEFIRERRPQSIRTLLVPTAAERGGDFSQTVTTAGKPISVNDPLNNKQQFPGNIIPANRIIPSMQAYMNLLPLPNYDIQSVAAHNYNYQVQESLNIPKILQTTRIDYIVNPKTTLWFKINYWNEDQRGWATSAGNANWGWMPSHYRNGTIAPVLAVTRILTRSMILEGSAAMTRWTEYGGPLNPSDLDRINKKTVGFNIPQLYPGNNPLNLLPNVTFGGTNPPNTSLNQRFPLRGAETPVVYNATLTNTRGPHVVKSGVYLENWKAVKGEYGSNWNGLFNFSVDNNNPNDANYGFANALLGNFQQYSESSSRPPLYENTTGIEWFVQDNWKVTRKLTLDAGLRVGWSQPWHSIRRQEAGFVPGRWDPAQAILLMPGIRTNNVRQAQDPLTGALYPASIIGALVNNHGNPYDGTVVLSQDPSYPNGLRNNSGLKAAPRFGFAYDPFGTGKTAIRGGIGLFYEIHEKDLWGYHLDVDPPNQLNPQIWYGNVNTFTNIQGFLFPSATSGMNPNRPLGRTINYSLGIQRDIGQGILLDASYVAALARHLLERKNINSVPLGTTLLPSAIDPSNAPNTLNVNFLRSYPGYGNIEYYNYDANSSYHSLQVMVTRRFKRGFTGGAAWTWSKAMDYDDSDTNDLSNLVDPKVWNYGRAGFDRTHILKLNWIYTVPRTSKYLPDWKGIVSMKKAILDDWQLSGITTFMSGAPAGVGLSFSSTYNANTWSGSPTDGGRPIMIANPVLSKDQQTFDHFFNTAAFGLGPQGTWGNAPKDVFRGPGINNWDISMFKNFRIHERYRAEFRCEAYNAFNHTQFSGVNTTANFDPKTGMPSNPLFGQFTSTRLPRRMQLALRITF
jgi:hypothetical protein